MLGEAFIVVSGLPASGKTTIGRYVAGKLGLPFLDKDDFLEREFENYAEVGPELRQQLSRKSDQALAAEAVARGTGVLVSFWRPASRAVSYGTTTEWLIGQTKPVIELYCRCEPQIARRRFETRTRHPGHNDAMRRQGLARQFQDLESFGPLGLWPVVTVDTSNLNDIAAISIEAIAGVRALLNTNG